MFECRKIVTGSKSPDPGNGIHLITFWIYFWLFHPLKRGPLIYSVDVRFVVYIEEYIGLDDNKYIGDLLAEFKAAKDRCKGEILHCKLIFKKKLFRESDESVADPMFVQLSYVQVCNLNLKSFESKSDQYLNLYNFD